MGGGEMLPPNLFARRIFKANDQHEQRCEQQAHAHGQINVFKLASTFPRLKLRKKQLSEELGQHGWYFRTVKMTSSA